MSPFSSAVRLILRRCAPPFKWQRIMFVCWRDRVLYHETIYLDSLKHRGSYLARKLDQELPKAA